MTPRGGHAGIVYRGGKLLAEWGDTARADMTFSVAKSYLALIAGLALGDGLIRSLDDKAGDYALDDGFRSEQNRDITWRHLLTQTSEWQGTLFGKEDRIDHNRMVGLAVAEAPKGTPRLLKKPGTFYEYNDVRVNRLSYSLLQVFKEPLPSVLKRRIMDPIGASADWRWDGYRNSTVTIDGKEMISVPGGGHWGGGIVISARDLALMGLLVAQGGAWNGKQILPKGWVEELVKPCRSAVLWPDVVAQRQQAPVRRGVGEEPFRAGLGQSHRVDRSRQRPRHRAALDRPQSGTGLRRTAIGRAGQMKLDYSAVTTMADGRTPGEYIQGIEAYWCIARVGFPELISRRGVSSRPGNRTSAIADRWGNRWLVCGSLKKRGLLPRLSLHSCSRQRFAGIKHCSRTHVTCAVLAFRSSSSARPIQIWHWRRDAVAHKPEPTPIALPLPDKPSIAVLPFQNMSGDPEQDYFADGMVEDTLTALSRIPSLFVIACSSSFAYKDKAVDVRQVGRDLWVRYVPKAACARRAEARRRSRSGSGDRHPAPHHAACWATVARVRPHSLSLKSNRTLFTSCQGSEALRHPQRNILL